MWLITHELRKMNCNLGSHKMSPIHKQILRKMKSYSGCLMTDLDLENLRLELQAIGNGYVNTEIVLKIEVEIHRFKEALCYGTIILYEVYVHKVGWLNKPHRVPLATMTITEMRKLAVQEQNKLKPIAVFDKGHIKNIILSHEQ